MRYDQRFDAVVKVDVPQVVQSTEESNHITCKDIQEALGISTYHVKLYLGKINASPIGKKVSTDDDGKKRRGPHIYFYAPAVLEQLRAEMEK